VRVVDLLARVDRGRPSFSWSRVSFMLPLSRAAARRRLRFPVFFAEEPAMSIDKSLRRKNQLQRSRNVLTRGERILQLRNEDRWPDERSPYGLPKVKVVKIVVKKAKKKEEKTEGEAVEGAAPAAAPPPAGKAPAGKAPAGKTP